MIKKLLFSIFNTFIVLTSSKAQTITTICGDGLFASGGDGFPAINAQLSNPNSLTILPSGIIYIADGGNEKIRKINTAGIITTYAGNGTEGYNDGPLVTSILNEPNGIVYDQQGNLYFADYEGNRIRKISTSGIISTIAGTGFYGYSGDGGLAINAQIYRARGLYIDPSGNIFFSDSGNGCVRKIDVNGIITTIAGNGNNGFGGDGGPAALSQLWNPNKVIMDGIGNLYIADAGNHRIRIINSNGIISTFAGIGTGGYSGDGGSAVSAELKLPMGLAFDNAGNLYICDYYNDCIRKVTPAGIISTCAGTGISGFSGDGGPPIAATFNRPYGITFDASGNAYIADELNSRIRKINCAQPSLSITTSNTLLCMGESATLSATGADIFLWDNNSTSSSIAISPTITSVYSIEGINKETGCKSIITFNQDVISCVSLPEIQNSLSELNIYPNPSSENFIVSFNRNLELTVLNGLGQILGSYQLSLKNDYTATISQLPCGVYFLKATNNENTISKRVVVVK